MCRLVDMFARLFVVFAACVYMVLSNQCYWNSVPYLYYGSKTLYDDVRGDIRDASAVEGCSPVSIWILARHGTRNPGAVNIAIMKDAMKLQDEIISNHEAGRGEICDQDIENLKKWKWNNTIDNTDYHLIARGYKELYEIGQRIHEKFEHLIEHLDYYYIRPTNEQRTKESAKAFVRGLEKTFDICDPIERDEVLTPYKICPVHRKEVWFGVQSQQEIDRYYNTKEFTQLIRDLHHRSGLSEPMSVINITGVYDLCRFFRGYSDDNRSPWCALFNHQDLTILDYSKDINHYFRNGYGHPINARLGEFALRDLREFFETALNSSTKSLKAYFSHDSLLEMVYSALGLFRDYPGISGAERIVGHKWQTSLNTPFAANIIAVLHHCPAVVDAIPYKVQIFVNEKAVKVCGEKTCSWDDFNKIFMPFHNDTLYVCKNTTALI